SAGRPAPPWQSTPYFDESRRSRKKLSIPGADMKSFHRLLLGQVGQKRRVCFRDIDERKRTSMIYAAIMGNLCPTQRTGAVKIYGRLQYFSLHAHLHWTVNPPAREPCEGNLDPRSAGQGIRRRLSA